ncbi:MAG: glycosyltransferase family 4 protein [Euryarchaeota archaeon]|nr:glycosyltransferase family 4 protein [Euryarchaeota archaeon]
MNKRIKIAFVGDVSSSFVKNDYEILSEFFDVDVVCPPKKKSGWLKFIFMLARKTKQSDVTFSWFAGSHSAFAVFFSNLFRKKSMVVVGGYDAAYFPEINYGAFTNIKEKIPALYVYKHVNKIIVVESSLKERIIKYAKINEDKIECIPTGFNGEYWKPEGAKGNVVLTVALAKDITGVKLKGLEGFCRSVDSFPDSQFIIIGAKEKAKDYLKKDAAKNLKFIEFLPQHELRTYYQRAKVYCQLSLDEGLPTALCEAMLCECIPVGSNINGIKTVIGDTGFYANYGDEQEIREAIHRALSTMDNQGEKARDRIKKLFSDKRKRETLKNLFSTMI